MGDCVPDEDVEGRELLLLLMNFENEPGRISRVNPKKDLVGGGGRLRMDLDGTAVSHGLGGLYAVGDVEVDACDVGSSMVGTAGVARK